MEDGKESRGEGMGNNKERKTLNPFTSKYLKLNVI